MWQLSEPNKSAAPSFISPAWEIRGCVQYSFCGVVQFVPRRCGPSPHAASEGALSPLGHQGEDNSKTCGPSFLLYFMPTQPALVSSLSCCLDSTCLFIIFFGACLLWSARIRVWTPNNSSVTAPPTRYWHGHDAFATCCNKHQQSKTNVHLESQCRVSIMLRVHPLSYSEIASLCRQTFTYRQKIKVFLFRVSTSERATCSVAQKDTNLLCQFTQWQRYLLTALQGFPSSRQPAQGVSPLHV